MIINAMDASGRRIRVEVTQLEAWGAHVMFADTGETIENVDHVVFDAVQIQEPIQARLFVLQEVDVSATLAQSGSNA